MMLASLLATAVLAQDAPITIDLKMNPRGLDFAGSRTLGAPYSPVMVALSANAPAGLKKAPAAAGTVRYGSMAVGNGPQATFHLALVTSPGEATLAVDLNQNGDFTDDATDWRKLPPSGEGAGPNWQGTVIFNASYKEGSRTWRAPYGVNFYYSERFGERVGSYRAGMLEGSTTVGGDKIAVRMWEGSTSGLFHLRYDTAPKPEEVRPVILELNGRRLNASGSFEWNGVNYLAEIRPDGSRVVLRPSARMVRPPAPPQAPRPPLLAAGTMAPDFTVDAFTGGQKKLSDFRGKVVILKFWASWCGPCIASMPHFEKVYQATKDKGVEILAVAVWDAPEDYQRWVVANRGKYSWNFYFDPAGKDTNNSIARKLYNVSGIPTEFVIGRDGKVVESLVGFQGETDKRLEAALQKAGISMD